MKNQVEIYQSRVVAWFSCGAASAVAAKMAIEKYGVRAHVVYCDTMSAEHPDNARFFSDVEKWLGVKIEIIKSRKYESVDDVFEKRAYMAGVRGAICTTEMKKVPRFNYQQADDVHVFGLTADERSRIEKFTTNNPELLLDWILLDRQIGKKNCLRILERAGIKLPAMYALGFENNNCIGCVKAASPAYWRKVRMHFPEVFARRAKRSREIGARLLRLSGERRFLDELPPDSPGALFEDFSENLSCGILCDGMQANNT